MITIHQRHRRTDRQTDRQTTCDRNTALCTKVHRAVKTLSAVNASWSCWYRVLDQHVIVLGSTVQVLIIIKLIIIIITLPASLTTLLSDTVFCESARQCCALAAKKSNLHIAAATGPVNAARRVLYSQPALRVCRAVPVKPGAFVRVVCSQRASEREREREGELGLLGGCQACHCMPTNRPAPVPPPDTSV